MHFTINLNPLTYAFFRVQGCFFEVSYLERLVNTFLTEASSFASLSTGSTYTKIIVEGNRYSRNMMYCHMGFLNMYKLLFVIISHYSTHFLVHTHRTGSAEFLGRQKNHNIKNYLELLHLH